MSAFTGLYWKELKISRVDFIVALVLMAVLLLAAFSAASYYDEPLFFVAPCFFVYFMHIWYLPLFYFSSLRQEGKSQIWLHNPQSGVFLFLAKLAAIFTYYAISLIIVFLCSFWGFKYIIQMFFELEFQGSGIKEMLVIAAFITGAGIYISIWLQFYWTVYHSLENNPYVKRFRWLIIFCLWLGLSIISEYIRNSFFYKKIYDAGVIQMHVLQGISFQVEQSSAEVLPSLGMIDIPIITILIYCLVTILVFSVSVWLLERKVEV